MDTIKHNIFYVKYFLDHSPRKLFDWSQVSSGLQSASASEAVRCSCCGEQSTQIVAYCGQCEGPVCRDCVTYGHQKMLVYKRHVLETRNLYKERAANFMQRIFMCQDHLEVTLGQYCLECDKLICSVCRQAQEVDIHGGHQVSDLNDKDCPLHLQLKQDMEFWMTRLKAKRVEATSVIESTCSHLDMADKEKKLFESNLNDFISKFIQFAEQLRDEMNKKAKERVAEKEVALSHRVSQLEHFYDRLDHVHNFIGNLNDQYFLTGLYRANKYLDERVKDLLNSDCVSGLSPLPTMEEYRINENREIADRFLKFLKSVATQNPLAAGVRMFLEHNAGMKYLYKVNYSKREASGFATPSPKDGQTSPKSTTPLATPPHVQEEPGTDPRVNGKRKAMFLIGQAIPPRLVVRPLCETSVSSSSVVSQSTSLCSICMDSISNLAANCTNCPKSFHRSCHLPQIERIELEANWRCVFCVQVEMTPTDGVLTHGHKIVSNCLFLQQCSNSTIQLSAPVSNSVGTDASLHLDQNACWHKGQVANISGRTWPIFHTWPIDGQLQELDHHKIKAVVH